MVENAAERSLCPVCRIPLRVKERRYIGAKFICPECDTRLVLSAVGPDQFTPETSATGSQSKTGHKLSATKALMGVASGLALGLLIFAIARQIIPPAKSPSQGTSPAQQQAEHEPTPVHSPTLSSETALKNLGTKLGDYVLREQQFPQPRSLGQTPAWSWLAVLVADESAKVDWDRPWNAVENEPFVRRQRAELLNPSLATTVGEDGWPTGHFAGVTGIGHDASRLPAGHPRAGLFGEQRTTRQRDLVDGASHTLAVVGVTANLGSWAAPGTPTSRALTREPYVNGPDGLGTGQNDGMWVLMADGRVQFVSQQMDPRLLRRLAAIGDGLPLDVQVTGEPGELAAEHFEPILAEFAEDEVPASPQPVAIVPPPRDWERLLSQRLTQVRQPKPVPRQELLSMIEDLVGTGIPLPERRAGRTNPWESAITLDLHDVTVRELLDAIVSGTGYRWRIVDQNLHWDDEQAANPSSE